MSLGIALTQASARRQAANAALALALNTAGEAAARIAARQADQAFEAALGAADADIHPQVTRLLANHRVTASPLDVQELVDAIHEATFDRLANLVVRRNYSNRLLGALRLVWGRHHGLPEPPLAHPASLAPTLLFHGRWPCSPLAASEPPRLQPIHGPSRLSPPSIPVAGPSRLSPLQVSPYPHASTPAPARGITLILRCPSVSPLGGGETSSETGSTTSGGSGNDAMTDSTPEPSSVAPYPLYIRIPARNAALAGNYDQSAGDDEGADDTNDDGDCMEGGEGQ
ncbi:hypothetical protein GGX14DRAFT_566391 [Mycena pura]|uniref:Uncharacterized protein n=1 Tax=Mycena pura TaxID=153505 RepID=A0AAD6YEM9_9AGAR|nr:hypothetical protein GGX14DRAFT_566391 [Mycena pura]